MQACSPERALAGMMAKHIVSLYDMAKLTAFDTVGGALEIKLGEVVYTE